MGVKLLFSQLSKQLGEILLLKDEKLHIKAPKLGGCPALNETLVCVPGTGHHQPVAYLGIFFGEGGSTNSIEDRRQRERGSGGGSPLFRGSGDSCNLVQEISFHMVKYS